MTALPRSTNLTLSLYVFIGSVFTLSAQWAITDVVRRLLYYSAGAGRTGTFCALSTVLERVKAEGILDVFQTVKSLRLQRPHMVQTLVC